jgi:hypothetical protein
MERRRNGRPTKLYSPSGDTRQAGEVKMDAATLYTVMAVASGPKRMTTEKFPTMAICERAAEKLRKKTPFSVKATYYCVKRKVDGPTRSAMPARKRPTPAAPAAPVGLPRDFYTGTTAKQ